VRRARSRAAKRERIELQRVINSHELAGDVAREHHLYVDAAHRYQDALNVQTIAAHDRQRISEKLAGTLLLGNDPSRAGAWHNTLLNSHLTHLGGGEEAGHALFQTAVHFWITSKTEAALPVLAQGIQIARLQGNAQLLKRANIVMATFLNLLARYEEAENFLNAAGAVTDKDTVAIRRGYWGQKGFVATAFGREREAFESFDRLVRLDNQDAGIYNMIIGWGNYAFAAMRLGRTEFAKTCHERALLLARQHNVVWLIPRICLEYAWLLTQMGQLPLAYEYLTDALSYDATAPVLDEAIASVGIPLALYMKDDSTLAKCHRLHAIDLAFMSAEPVRIGLISVAFARLYGEQGHRQKARAVLHRAVEAMHNVVHAWDLPLEVARSGERADIPKARQLLTARTQYPCAAIAEAYLWLFEAFVDRRDGRTSKAYAKARDAVTCFEALRWNTCADLARSILPADQRLPGAEEHHEKPFSGTDTMLTEREREVAALVLKGFTNRKIADILSISPHTVDSHVNSIMSRLGIRSRHQLAYVLPEHA